MSPTPKERLKALASAIKSVAGDIWIRLAPARAWADAHWRVAAGKTKASWQKRALTIVLGLFGGGAFALLTFLTLAFLWYQRDLPDYEALKNYEPPITTRIYAGDGSLVDELAAEKRVFMPIDAIPDRLKQAFIAAEDKKFYTHSGIDLWGMARAGLSDFGRLARGRSLAGGSTITQQVARNFLLTLDQRLDRKIKEIILTKRIENAFTKDHILELYLNEIYLGGGSYGVGAAALNYFNKGLDELTLGEMAYLAAVPKGPNNYNPIRHHDRAVERRNWVLDRMEEEGYISEAEMLAAKAEPLIARIGANKPHYGADYYVEEVRRLLIKHWPDRTYTGGLVVRTSLDPLAQATAERALQAGLVLYDRRHGWRGPLGHADLAAAGWKDALKADRHSLGVPGWRKAAVLRTIGKEAQIVLADGTRGTIPFEELKWARRWNENETLGPAVTAAADVLQAGDIIAVAPLPDKPGRFSLQQIPDISGAILAMDPHTGRVLAMAGGFDFATSQFNRATQAFRQPGSVFKPFVYAAALEAGYTPSTRILDAPFAAKLENNEWWTPKNFASDFLGPATMRRGLELSRNLMTLRLAQTVGMGKVIDLANRFGVGNGMRRELTMALGSNEVRLIDLVTAYSSFVNGGKKISPGFIDRVQDAYGNTLWKEDKRDCKGCAAEGWSPGLSEPDLPDIRPQIYDPRHAYQLVHMLEGVVQRGTGASIGWSGRPLAGKTGTTNSANDTWFIGFSPDLVAGIYVGFDKPRSLGRHEEGASVAVPVFRNFIYDALKNTPVVPFRVPSGIRLVQVDLASGLPAQPGDQRVITEAFIPGTEPTGSEAVLDGGLGMMPTEDETPADAAPKPQQPKIY